MQMVREFIKTALEGDKEDVAEHEQALLLKTFRASRALSNSLGAPQGKRASPWPWLLSP